MKHILKYPCISMKSEQKSTSFPFYFPFFIFLFIFYLAYDMSLARIKLDIRAYFTNSISAHSSLSTTWVTWKRSVKIYLNPLKWLHWQWGEVFFYSAFRTDSCSNGFITLPMK